MAYLISYGSHWLFAIITQNIITQNIIIGTTESINELFELFMTPLSFQNPHSPYRISQLSFRLSFMPKMFIF
jgi:hypothetical protein